MASFLQRLLGRPSSPSRFELASLQLRLLVSMAMADDRVKVLETDHLVDFIDRAAATKNDYDRLCHLLDELLVQPPHLDALLGELAGHAELSRLGDHLVSELTAMAWSDDEIDHREAFLIDLVCDVFGLPPVELFGGAGDGSGEYEDLHRFVSQLAHLGRAA